MSRRELRRFDPGLSIEQARTPPFTWYLDAELFEQEKHDVFEKSWIAVGRADQVPGPGSYFSGEVVGNPYVVVRDDQGELRAFHNVCRHHAAEVAREHGQLCELVCPYHGWSYALDGRLKKAPRMGRLEEFDPAQFGLKPIAVTTWGPFVFIDLDGSWGGSNNPRDLASDLGPVKQRLEDTQLEKLRWVERRVYDMHCNWKVFVDNSLDGGYHVAYAHEGLAAGLEFAGYGNL